MTGFTGLEYRHAAFRSSLEARPRYGAHQTGHTRRGTSVAIQGVFELMLATRRRLLSASITLPVLRAMPFIRIRRSAAAAPKALTFAGYGGLFQELRMRPRSSIHSAGRMPISA